MVCATDPALVTAICKKAESISARARPPAPARGRARIPSSFARRWRCHERRHTNHGLRRAPRDLQSRVAPPSTSSVPTAGTCGSASASCSMSAAAWAATSPTSAATASASTTRRRRWRRRARPPGLHGGRVRGVGVREARPLRRPARGARRRAHDLPGGAGARRKLCLRAAGRPRRAHRASARRVSLGRHARRVLRRGGPRTPRARRRPRPRSRLFVPFPSVVGEVFPYNETVLITDVKG